MVFTVGLARPWAAVRSWRYLADHTAMTGPDTLDHFIDSMAEAGPATAAEFLDIEGIDFGI